MSSTLFSQTETKLKHMIFGYIYPQGKGNRSPEIQRHLLKEAGAERFVDYIPILRRGDHFLFCYPESLAENAPELCQSFVAILECAHMIWIETGTEYNGCGGMAQLVEDFFNAKRKLQTANARRAKKKKPKLGFPKFYIGLSDEERHEFTVNAGLLSWAELAQRYGTSRASARRAAIKLGITKGPAE